MIQKELFGKLPCGCEVYAYTLSNNSGTAVRILNLGGILQSILVKDAKGEIADVVCGYDTVEGYLNAGGYQGALIGRYGNRIGKSTFTLEGETYHLYNNDGVNHLHGGKKGFDKKLWKVTEAGTADEPALILTIVSPDGENWYEAGSFAVTGNSDPQIYKGPDPQKL